MKKETQVLAAEDFHVDLTLHNVPASLLSKFAEKIVHPYYQRSLKAAVQNLLNKAIAEQDFVHSHITHIRNAEA